MHLLADGAPGSDGAASAPDSRDDWDSDDQGDGGDDGGTGNGHHRPIDRPNVGRLPFLVSERLNQPGPARPADMTEAMVAPLVVSQGQVNASFGV